MLALEVRLNGELKATCRAEELHSIVASVRANRESSETQDFSFRIECSGSRVVDPETSEFVKWVSAMIRRGDEVSLKFVEAPDGPLIVEPQAYPSS